ncbi:CoA pyrophosphatase [Myxococcota bacterium]|nr:CoA pyrophosphatase [Myxococcota bacterium]
MKVDLFRSILAQRTRPEPAPPAYAAVAMVLRERANGAEVLFIERAMREGDPWSGHMAFPGGRLEGEDDSPRTAACRETFEEVGLEIARAEYLGHLCDLTGRSGSPAPMLVSAHAFHLEQDQPLALDPNEVRSAFWFPLAELHSASRRTTHRIEQLPEHVFPAILVGEPGRHFVWGLTYRFLEEMFKLADRPFSRK